MWPMYIGGVKIMTSCIIRNETDNHFGENVCGSMWQTVTKFFFYEYIVESE